MPKSILLYLLALITFLGVGLRSWQLTARSLWFDEAFSWRLIQFPFTKMISQAATDVHPPLYYILLKGWQFIFSSSLLSLRSFSVTLAAVTILAGYLFTAYAFRSRLTGLIAATLLAISGWQIQFAWEARMYTLGTALVFFSSWLLLRAIRRPTLFRWLSYGVITAAFAYVHYFAFFSIAAQFIFIAAYTLIHTRGRLGEMLQWRLLWFALLAVFTMGLLYLPWLPTFFAQNSQVQQNYWIPAIGGWSIPDTFYRMFAPTSGIPQHQGLGWISLSALPIIATGLGWLFLAVAARRSSRYPADATYLTVLSGLVPFILAIMISLFSQSLYQDRFFVFANLFIIIALAILIAHLRPTWLKLSTFILAIIGFSITNANYWQELDIVNRPGAHAATRHIYQRLQPSDSVLVSSPFIYFAIDHYTKEEFRSNNLPQLYFAKDDITHFAGGPILMPDDLADSSILDNADSLWVVDTTGFGSSPLVLPVGWQAVDHQTYAEVFPHQGEVIVTHYKPAL